MSAPLHVRIVVLFSVISSTTKFISAASAPDAKVLTLVCYNHDVITASVSARNGKMDGKAKHPFAISSFFFSGVFCSETFCILLALLHSSFLFC